jgi:probable rRNA maturation factor
MEINILIDEGFEKYLTPDWLENLVQQVLVAEHADTRAEVGLVITGEDKIRELHRLYLDEDTVTDVLSFPMTEPALDQSAFINPPDALVHLGEVIVCYSQAVKQAEEHHHSAKKEVALLIVHGVLHLLGYDHDIPEREQIMRERESTILNTIKEEKLA